MEFDLFLNSYHLFYSLKRERPFWPLNLIYLEEFIDPCNISEIQRIINLTSFYN